jgi:hypothetical protein
MRVEAPSSSSPTHSLFFGYGGKRKSVVFKWNRTVPYRINHGVFFHSIRV